MKYKITIIIQINLRNSFLGSNFTYMVQQLFRCPESRFVTSFISCSSVSSPITSCLYFTLLLHSAKKYNIATSTRFFYLLCFKTSSFKMFPYKHNIWVSGKTLESSLCHKIVVLNVCPCPMAITWMNNGHVRNPLYFRKK